jgi:hypothetical protein
MPDITKCSNDTCGLRMKCWRFLAPDSEYRQSYARFETYYNLIENEDSAKIYLVCDEYWEVNNE